MNKKLVEGQGLENAYNLLLKYQRDLNIDKLTEETILTFFKKWVKLKSKNSIIRPYALNNMSYYLLKIVNDRNLIKHKYSIFKSKLKKLTNIIAKKLFSSKLQETKRAEIFSMSEIYEIAEALWLGNAMSKAASVKLKITFMTGCRSGDLNSCYWKDIKKIDNKGEIFYSIPMRYSKTNPRALKKEHITIRESNDSRWSILKILTKYNDYLVQTEQLGNKIFPDKPTRAFVYYYEKVAKKLGYIKRLTGHSGRNSTLVRLFEANVPTEDICIQYHWRRNSEMVFHYRNILLETTKLGAPYALSKYDEACNYK
jgi:hypothetical protein